MKTQNKRIYIQQWLEQKPYSKQVSTDLYYLRLCNDVKQVMQQAVNFDILENYLDNEKIDALACYLVSYFEDIISKTNIWNSFVRVHQRQYGKYLPFYDTSTYYENEINHQDVSFLIWFFINTVQEHRFVDPVQNFIIEIADKVMNIFEDEWGVAPENEKLKEIYAFDENETEFYIVRNFIDTVLFKTYLFYSDTFLDLREVEFDILEGNKENPNVLDFLNNARDHLVFSSYSRFLAMKGQEWVAEILGAEHKLSNDFRNISKKVQGFFLYKGQDNENIFIEHIASGRQFNLTKKSFDDYKTLDVVDTILFIGIVKWQNEWWFSGIYMQQDFDADLVLNEKNSIDSRMVVNFLEDKNNHKEILDLQQQTFYEFTDGSQLTFVERDKAKLFFETFIEYYNNSLDLSEQQKKKAIKSARAKGFLGDETNSSKIEQTGQNATVFFNPINGLEIADNIASAFPVPNNPFYNESESEENVFGLLTSIEISAELAKYCILNFKDQLSFFKTDRGKVILEDYDFLLRFWKRGIYRNNSYMTTI